MLASLLTLLHLAVSGAAATANDTGQSKWSIFACFTTSQVHLDSIFLCIRKSTLGRKQKPNNFHHYRIFPEPGNNALPLVAPMASFRSIVSRFAPTALHAVLLVRLFRRSVLFSHLGCLSGFVLECRRPTCRSVNLFTRIFSTS